jgi:soluble lytic murein transglycosylase
MIAIFRILALALGLWLVPASAATPPIAADPDIEQLRRDYSAAMAALRAGELSRYARLRARLDGYLLRGYLDYEFLKDRIATTPAATLVRFLEENRDAPVGNQLRRKWLHHLATRGEWDTFMRELHDVADGTEARAARQGRPGSGFDDDTELNCFRLGYLLRITHNQAALMSEIGRLWQNGDKLPGACDPLFAAWRQAGHMTAERVWERIQLAMEKRNLTLAEKLAGYLPAGERVWVERWLAMHRNPQKELQNIRYPAELALARRIIRHGIMRVAYTDPDQAMQIWKRLKTGIQFSSKDENYVHRWVGVLAAQKHHPEAVEWLSAVAPEPGDETARHWRVRAAVRAGEWKTGLHFINDLTEDEQKQSEWRYWKARMLDKAGFETVAAPLFGELARERNYYGFLAADRLNQEYSMTHVAIEPTADEIKALLARPGVQIAYELFTLGETVSARRQWSWTIRGMSSRELQVAAVIARQWGWHDRAIMTVGRSNHLDDLDLRFPILYRRAIEVNAEQNSIDPGWMYGVLRQESAFMADARSSAGALGLMQLMPQTGRLTARRINLAIDGNNTILKIENNLRLGASYLKQVLDINNGHAVLATASYNAGPHRVKEWLPASGELDADAWVEAIPFNETRNYVKNVLGFTTVYDYRLHGGGARLNQRMPTVPSATKQ